MFLQVEGEHDEQSSADQASAIKTKNVFIAQNVASLQELGKNRSEGQKAGSSASVNSETCKVSFLCSRWLREAAACLFELAVFPALHQSIPRCSVGQVLLYHACDCCRCHCSS